MLRFVDPCLGIYLFSMTSSSFMQYVESCDESINETRVLCCHLSQPSANFSLQPWQIFPRRIFPPRSEKAYPVMGFTKPAAGSRARWRPAGNWAATGVGSRPFPEPTSKSPSPSSISSSRSSGSGLESSRRLITNVPSQFSLGAGFTTNREESYGIKKTSKTIWCLCWLLRGRNLFVNCQEIFIFAIFWCLDQLCVRQAWRVSGL